MEIVLLIFKILIFIPSMFVVGVLKVSEYLMNFGVNDWTHTELNIIMFIIIFVGLSFMGVVIDIFFRRKISLSNFIGWGSIIDLLIAGWIILITNKDWEFYDQPNEMGVYVIDLASNPYGASLALTFVMVFIADIIIGFVMLNFDSDEKNDNK